MWIQEGDNVSLGWEPVKAMDNESEVIGYKVNAPPHPVTQERLDVTNLQGVDEKGLCSFCIYPCDLCCVQSIVSGALMRLLVISVFPIQRSTSGL